MSFFNPVQKPKSAVPDSRDLISHRIIKHVKHNMTPEYSVEFTYPDCIRTFDGKNWSVRALRTAQSAARA